MKYLFGIFGSNFSKVLGIFLFIFVFADVLKPQQNHNNVADGQISGIFIDFHTKEPLEFVNFILTSLKDSNLITGITSGKDGRFLLKGIAYDSYKAKVSLMGYKTRTRSNMVLSPKQHTIQLDTIFLMQKEIVTEEVKIISDKYPIVYDKENKDKLIISPDRNWGNNAYELLESAPLVDVDIISGDIKIFGKPSTTIYIDGQPKEFSGISEPEDLRALTISEIEKIEIIMNAVAEYGVISDGGIINIVTKQNKTDRYSGNAALNVSNYNSHSTDEMIKSTFGRLTLTGRYSNSYSNHKKNTTSLKEFEYENTSSHIGQNGDYFNKLNKNLFSINAFLIVDTTSNVNFSSSYKEELRNNDKTIVNNTLDQYDLETSRSTSSSNTRGLHRFLTNSFTFHKSFDKKSHYLNGGINYFNNRMIQNNDVNLQQVISNSFMAYETNQKNTSVNTNNMLLWNLSYNRPISKEINLAGKYDGSSKKLAMHSTYSLYDTLTQRYLENINNRIMGGYSETVHNLSLSGSGTIFDFQYDLGMTAAQTSIKVENKVLNFTYQTHLFNLNSTASLSRNISENGRFSLRYYRHSINPSNNYLNPYVDYSDSTNIIVGNTGLKPIINNLYTVNYFIVDKDFNGFIRVDYTVTTNGIELVTHPINWTATQTTYENIATRKSYNLALSLSNKFWGWMELSSDFYIRQFEYISPKVNNKGRTWSPGFGAKLSFDDLVFQFDCRYSSPSSYRIQEKSKANFSANAAAKMLFFDKSLALTLRVIDLFNTNNSNSDTYGPGFSSTNSIKERTRVFTLDIFYFFNSQANENIVEQNSDAVPDDF
ncbi:MAG: outer membrane beta-barrel family protein [Ignavibacteria bacterium]|nr:outer membrane beta-barrel family protein [Ignavibacteria bacterium]